MDILQELLALQDTDYKAFNAKLIPTIDPDTVIGVRVPALRKLAKAFSKDPQSAEFIKALPHRYFEENSVHAYLIETIKDFDECIAAIDAFLPYIDNWATCDSLAPKVLSKHPDKLILNVKRWIGSTETYTVRFGLGTLMRFYLDDSFLPEYLELAASVRSDEYYVNMMIAWFFATALAKQGDATLPYIENKLLDKWVHNKTIQKAIESYRITDDMKAYLKTLRIK